MKTSREEYERYSWHVDIALDSFCANGMGKDCETEEEATASGALRVHEIVQDHINNSKQPMSEKDQELIIKFFESCQN